MHIGRVSKSLTCSAQFTMSMETAMFNNTCQSSESVPKGPAPEDSYVEVAGLMDDFISIEEVAPDSDYSDLLAASWGIPCETATPEARPTLSLKTAAIKVIRSLVQASRSKMEVA